MPDKWTQEEYNRLLHNAFNKIDQKIEKTNDMSNAKMTDEQKEWYNKGFNDGRLKQIENCGYFCAKRSTPKNVNVVIGTTFEDIDGEGWAVFGQSKYGDNWRCRRLIGRSFFGRNIFAYKNFEDSYIRKALARND